MNTTTFELRGTDGRALRATAPKPLARVTAALELQLKSLVRRLNQRTSNGPAAAAALLRQAEAYESTQPSYAADLRAAAYRTEAEAR
jgi:hypothetical protein